MFTNIISAIEAPSNICVNAKQQEFSIDSIATELHS